jgi:hypothetical protein
MRQRQLRQLTVEQVAEAAAKGDVRAALLASVIGAGTGYERFPWKGG